MFETSPKRFKMNIYPSRRSCAVPPEVLELTKENALLIDDGEGVEGEVGSIPFPFPSEALQRIDQLKKFLLLQLRSLHCDLLMN